MKAITLLSASALYMSTLSQAKQLQGEDKSIDDILEKLEKYRSEVQAYETKV